MFFRALVLLFASSLSAQAVPISLNWSVTDLGGSYQYDFTLVADNNDGTFVNGMGWDWLIIGDVGFGEPPLFSEGIGFFTSLPLGWGATVSSGGSNGPTLGAVDGSVVGLSWTPLLGESVSFTGVSSTLVTSGEDLRWSSLVTSGGAGRFVRVASTVVEAPPIPLPAGAWLLLGGLAGMAALRRRRRAA